MYKHIENELLKLKNPNKAKILQSFFKTGKGEYGEGDIFLGITVPQQRNLVKKYWEDINLEDIQKLLKNQYHEFRMTGLLFLVQKYEKSNSTEKNKIFNFYLNNIKYVNSRDLVDLSCPKIIGDYLLTKNRKILYDFTKSENLRTQRIAIVSTYTFIKSGDFQDTIKISKLLLSHKHDLIHKAVGRMLREIGKKDENILINFLENNASKMSRTTLRYAIEKFNKEQRKHFLSIKKTI
ncbi:MAG: DNA alkylation repair protein [Candidatus Absconditabacterales bacterium]|nr:DNA alkylation repair protein [Candidatus Absconditabacterales bacterium]